MRLSDFTAPSKVALAAGLGAVALLAAAPAHAQGWGVLTSPKSDPRGDSYCMLWYGEKRPLMNVTVVGRNGGTPWLAVAADELAGVSGKGEAELRFFFAHLLDDDERGTRPLEYSAPAEGAIMSRMPKATFEYMLEVLASGTGSLIVTIEGRRVSFPVVGLEPRISTLRQCMNALP